MSHIFFRRLTNQLLLLATAVVLVACTVSPVPPMSAPPTETQILPAPTPQGRTLLVISPANSGPGTLRQAMQDAQSYDTITFDPLVFPPDAPVSIFVINGLPQIHQDNLTIDASNAGVILDGSQLSRETWIPGLETISDGNIIRGLQVIHFTGTGLVVAGGQNNVIGGDRNTGAGPIGQGNLSSSNDFGIGVWAHASNNIVTGNLIGTDIRGIQALGNRVNGVWITGDATNNTIGPDNLIAYNNGPGIRVDGAETTPNTITRNKIHDNGSAGIHIDLWSPDNNELPVPLILDFDLQNGNLAGASCAHCLVEIFSDDGDEGEVYEGYTAADAMGVFTFDKGSAFTGPNLTTTATNSEGNTSEFSMIANTTRVFSFQQGNNLPRTIFKFKVSRDLADNRIGLMFYSPDTPGPPSFNFPVDEIIASGVKRIDVALTENEPPIDWSFSETEFPPEYDQFIDVLIENDIAINHMLHFWDKEGHPGGEGLDRPRFQNQEQIDDFLEYVRFVVGHFKGRAGYYTIWSEPDYCGHDELKCILPEDYIELARQVIPVIREIDPEAKIVSAPYVLYFGRDQLFTVLSSDVVNQFDVISWHPIFDVLPDSEFYGNYYYEYPALIREIKQTASAHGFEGEYWGASISWCSKDLPDSCPLDYGREVPETNLQAAKYYARGIMMELGMDVGVGLGGYLIGWPRSDSTIRNLNTVMAGNKPLEIPVEIESDASHLTSYGFSLPNGDRLFAVWNDNVAVDYDPDIPSTLTFPGTSAQKVIAIDVLHGFEQELIIEIVDGSLVIRDFLIKDYPIILRLIE